MRKLALILALKVVSFCGATLNTAGFLTFFFWPSIAPYRWHMIIGGVALIVVSELAVRGFARHRASHVPHADP